VEKLPLSLVIITFNEEKNISFNMSRCIRSVPFASDILVVDSSTAEITREGHERPLEVARKLGARTLQEPWRGVVKMRTRATALARTDWVLVLDLNEALSPEAQNEIYGLLRENKNTAAAYALSRRQFFLGRFMAHSGGGSKFQTRLISREKVKWADGETEVDAQNIVKLKSPILHWPYETISAQIETIDQQSNHVVTQLMAKNETFSSRKMVKDVIGTLVRMYWRQKAYADGIEGLLASFVTSIIRFFGWSKLYENELRIKNLSSKDASK
jgi:Glycosyl transferase family 2